MATEKVNKSALIREYLAKNPDMKPGQLAEAINQDHPKLGIDSKMISTVKVNAKKKEGGETRRVGRPAGSGPGLSMGVSELSVSQAVAVLQAVRKTIGAAEAKQVLDLLEAGKT